MEVITLNKNTLNKKCLELISKVDFQPDAIVSVLNGGGFVVDVIKREIDCESILFMNVKLQRRRPLIKKILVFWVLVKLFNYKILDWFRRQESISVRKSIKWFDLNELSNIKVNLELNSNSKVKNILIIDDAIDTGRTIFVVLNNLKRQFSEANIKIAVIAWTIEDSIVKPDYFIFKNDLIRFPWSKDYKGKDFEKSSRS